MNVRKKRGNSRKPGHEVSSRKPVSVSSTFLFGSAGIGLDGLDLDKDGIEEIDEIVGSEEEHAKKVAEEQLRIDAMKRTWDSRSERVPSIRESYASSDGPPNLREMVFFDEAKSEGGVQDEPAPGDRRMETEAGGEGRVGEEEERVENGTAKTLSEEYLKPMGALHISRNAMETFRMPLPDCSFAPFAASKASAV